MSDKKHWMIYGANGYTGRLIAEEAKRQDLVPILAGRNLRAIEALAGELALPCRVFDLADGSAARAALADVAVVANCAGPFSATSERMIDACLATRTHYADITGEIAVFVDAQLRHDVARAAGIVICPGVGFDVIPTDCVAACLKEALPDATQLALGFAGAGAISPGTARTSIEGLKLGGRVRTAGHIVRSTARVSRTHDRLRNGRPAGRDFSMGRHRDGVFQHRHSQYRGLHRELAGGAVALAQAQSHSQAACLGTDRGGGEAHRWPREYRAIDRSVLRPAPPTSGARHATAAAPSARRGLPPATVIG